jgi:hypothetical protein
MLVFTSTLLMMGRAPQQLFDVEFSFSLLLSIVKEVTTNVTSLFLTVFTQLSLLIFETLCA